MNQSHSLRAQLARGKAFLKENGTASYALDAAVLLMAATGHSRADLLIHYDETMTDAQLQAYAFFLRQRAAHKPVAYILNHREFMSLDFMVNENVLIPRPDTEVLVEAVMAFMRENDCKTVIDMGTGSGCIAVCLAFYCENVFVTAADISAAALAVAQKNANRHGVANRIRFVQSDLFAAWPQDQSNMADVIISNPPYIPTGDVAHLAENVRFYEPHHALDGGTDGLDFYRKISVQSLDWLRPGGLLAFEIGYNQGEDVRCLLAQNGYHRIQLLKDLAGLGRVVMGCRGEQDSPTGKD